MTKIILIIKTIIKIWQAPSEGRESLVPLTDNYFELEKNDDRYKALVNNLTNIVPQAKVTSVYISKRVV
jgi:hypothetical protein